MQGTLSRAFTRFSTSFNFLVGNRDQLYPFDLCRERQILIQKFSHRILWSVYKIPVPML